MPPKNTGKTDGRLTAAQSRKLQTAHTDMATTLAMIANVGTFGAGKARMMARECLARVGGEGASE